MSNAAVRCRNRAASRWRTPAATIPHRGLLALLLESLWVHAKETNYGHPLREPFSGPRADYSNGLGVFQWLSSIPILEHAKLLEFEA
eukprot:11091749-Alexandrium_andersonii.AAC.1